MNYLEEKNFFFESSAINPVTQQQYPFSVVSFSGTEDISRLYEFEITLVSSVMEIDIDAILSNPATLYLKPGNKVPVHGIISNFEQLNEVDGNVFYKAILVPRLWKLTLYNLSEVFLDMTVPEIIAQVLDECPLAETTDYEMKLIREVPTGADTADYRKGWRIWPYICQYQESHFNFISRWMEREGIYYYFDQTASGEKMIITNTSLSHDEQRTTGKLFYSPPSGQEIDETSRPATAFICRQKMLPSKLILQDVNYQKTSNVITGQAPVSPIGQGEVYIHGEHLESNEEANLYAQVRAEEMLCRQKIFIGETLVPNLRVGFFVILERHYRTSFNNNKYLVLRIDHEGSQPSLLAEGVTLAGDNNPFYRNSIEAILEGVQFRPERITPKPRIYGTVQARIDKDQSLTEPFADIDTEGRYKVKLPFDRPDPNATQERTGPRKVVMAQPYAGPDEGMQFPLREDTQVLLTFMDGDPDRPVIAGAVPDNANQNILKDVLASPATVENTVSRIKTKGGNLVELEDKAGGEQIRIQSPGDLWLEAKNRYADYKVGAPPKADTPSPLQYLHDKFYDAAGDFRPTGLKRYDNSVIADADWPADDAGKWSALLAHGQVRLAKGDTFITQDGNIYDFGGYWNYNLGNNYVEEHVNQKAELNTNPGYDLMDAGGPGWTKVDKIQDSGAFLSQGGSKNELATWGEKATHSSSNDWKNIWVEKKFGDAYEYREGNTISVQKGSTQEIFVGARSVVEKYSSGAKTYFMKSGGGETTEQSWSKISGLPMTFSYAKTEHFGHGKIFSYSHTWANSISFSTNFAASFSLGISLDAKLAISLNLAAVQDIGVYVGYKGSLQFNLAAETDIKFSASASFKLDLSASAYIDIKGALAAYMSYNTVTKAFKAKVESAEVQKAAALQAKKEDLILETLTTVIYKRAGEIACGEWDIKKRDIYCAMGQIFAGL